MAPQTIGPWTRDDFVPYDTALIWGTGVNPIHAEYGEGPPIYVTGRPGQYTDSHRNPSKLPDLTKDIQTWGYTPEDWNAGRYANYYYPDDRPGWNLTTPDFRDDSDGFPNWGVQPDSGLNVFRGIAKGAHQVYSVMAKLRPTETVSEGWENKPKGNPADSRPSDDKQLIVGTSMVQRYETRVNDHAVTRATDDPRSPIHSRVTGQKLKFYSRGEREYDMFPYQQDIILRGFWYRTAGTGYPEWLRPNEVYDIGPLQRDVPPLPYMGPEVPIETENYGYTGEDNFYA